MVIPPSTKEFSIEPPIIKDSDVSSVDFPQLEIQEQDSITPKVSDPRRTERLSGIANMFDDSDISVSAEVIENQAGKSRLEVDWKSKERDFKNLGHLFTEAAKAKTNAEWQTLLFGKEFKNNDEFVLFAKKVELVMEKMLALHVGADLDFVEPVDDYAQQLDDFSPEEEEAYKQGEMFRIVLESDFLIGLLNRKILNFDTNKNSWKPISEHNDSTFVHAMWELWSMNVEEQPEVADWGETRHDAEYLAWWEGDESKPGNYKQVMKVFSIFHDFGKAVKPGYLDHGLLSAEIARDYFQSRAAENPQNFDPEFAERVEFLIEHHHIFYYLTKEFTQEGTGVKAQLAKTADQVLALKLLLILNQEIALDSTKSLDAQHQKIRDLVRGTTKEGKAQKTLYTAEAFEDLGDENLDDYIKTMQVVLRSEDFEDWRELAGKVSNLEGFNESDKKLLAQISNRVAENMINHYYLFTLPEKIKKLAPELKERFAGNMSFDDMINTVFMGKGAEMSKSVPDILGTDVDEIDNSDQDAKDAHSMTQAVLERIKNDPYILMALIHFTMSDVMAGKYKRLISENIIIGAVIKAGFGIREKRPPKKI